MPLIAFLVVNLFLGHAFGAVLQVDPLAAGAVVGSLTILANVATPSLNGSLRVGGLPVEVWEKYIEEKLFKLNAFLKHATSHDKHVLAGKVVHIPQAGAPANVVKNRSVFPAVAVRRADADINYSLDNYTTDPSHVLFDELADLSYNKIDSVIGQDVKGLVESAADDMIWRWLLDLPQTSIIRTSGDASADFNFDGATGNRKMFTEKDLRRCAAKIRKQNVKDPLFAQLSVEMMESLKDSMSLTQERDFSQYFDAKNGIIGRLHGVTILEERSDVALFEESGGDAVIKAPGAAVAATDFDAGFVWAESAVARAMGETKLFQNLGDAQYYGDVSSTYLRCGGRRTRQDNAGIVAVVQAPDA